MTAPNPEPAHAWWTALRDDDGPATAVAEPVDRSTPAAAAEALQRIREATTGAPVPTVSEVRTDIENVIYETLGGEFDYPACAELVDALAAAGFLHLGPVVPDDPQVLKAMLADAVAMAPTDLDELAEIIAEKLYDDANEDGDGQGGGLPGWVDITNDLVMPAVRTYVDGLNAARDAELDAAARRLYKLGRLHYEDRCRDRAELKELRRHLAEHCVGDVCPEVAP
jgi:hypothetical protein